MRKKIFIFIILNLLFVAGCTSSSPTYEITKSQADFTAHLQYQDSDIELLRNDNQLIYVNELNTEKNPFLFETESLLVFDVQGQLSFKIKNDKQNRIIDFIKINNDIYYMTLISKDNKYNVELFIYNENGSDKRLASYDLDDPYAYPTFKMFNEDYYYKINNDLYTLSNQQPFLKIEKEWFLGTSDSSLDSILYKVVSPQGYTLMEYKNGQHISLGLEEQFGTFIKRNNLVIYDNVENKSLYVYDIETKKKELIFDKDVFDFQVLAENIIVISSDTSIYFYDLDKHEIIDTINKDNKDIKIVSHWIYTDRKEYVSFQGEDKIYTFRIQKNNK